jgi:spermidine/putrescine-binding protein
MDGQIGVMRKIITTIVAAGVLLTLSGCGDSVTGRGNDNVVNVYNWADYIDLDVIQQFEEEYGNCWLVVRGTTSSYTATASLANSRL